MKKTNRFVLAIGFASASLLAQPPKPGTADRSATFDGPAQDAPAALKKIFSNLGPSTSTYSSTAIWAVTGPLSGLAQQSVALPFTPAASAHVRQVRAALQNQSSVANQVNLSLYSDNNGVPGTLLAGPVAVTSLPTYPSCCTLAIASFPNVAVTAGTRYWIVADTPATGPGSDLNGTWNWVHSTLVYSSNFSGLGWYTQQGNTEPAGAVYGTIP